MTTLEEHLEDWLDERVGLLRALSTLAMLVYLTGVTSVWRVMDQWTVAGVAAVLILTIALAVSFRGLAQANRVTDKTASRQLTRLALTVIFFPTVMVNVTLMR